MREIGEEAYNAEQRRKIEILRFLPGHFNDGRRKTFFCVAVNLLELAEDAEELPPKEKSAQAVRLFQQAAQARVVELKLHKKK